MSEADLVAEMRERHNEDAGWCHYCDRATPCDAIRLADEIERLRAALERIAKVDYFSEPNGEPLIQIARSAQHTDDSRSPAGNAQPKPQEKQQ